MLVILNRSPPKEAKTGENVWNHQLDKLQNHEQNMICSICSINGSSRQQTKKTHPIVKSTMLGIHVHLLS